MNTRIFWLLAVGAVFSFEIRLAKAEDVERSQDHPLIKRYPGSSICGYRQKQFDEFDFPLAPPVDGKYPQTIHVEGRITGIRYRVPEDRSPLEISRNYESALKAAGAEVLFTCAAKACGNGKTTDYIGQQELDWDFYVRRAEAFKLPRPDGPVYVLLTFQEESTALIIAEVKPMASRQVDVNAEELKSSIDSSGRALVYGIYFDTAKTALKPESEPTLRQIAQLLSQNPALKLYVVGHTDDVGTLASNLELSKGRAQAVVNALKGPHKIAADRLLAYGVGPLAPVATNRTEAGRAKNRRVELVEATASGAVRVSAAADK